jgi:hypothetical protein
MTGQYRISLQTARQSRRTGFPKGQPHLTRSLI